MANLSDNEMFEIDSIIQQRKRKGVLEYLVRWKGSGDELNSESWEPAKHLALQSTQAVQKFLKNQKTKSKFTLSRSRNRSGSRSRSSSRGRKAAASKTPRRVSSRSRSRGRSEKKPLKQEVAESSKSTRSSQSKGLTITVESNSVTSIKAVLEPVQGSNKIELEAEGESQSQIMRSSTMKTREELEVQRVHNEQRPIRDDDNKPRSAIWKVADYAVIILFIISAFAAVILFLEKFIDLEEFKKQAYPNLEVLKTRLEAAWQNLTELIVSWLDRVWDLWLYLVQMMKGNVKSKA